MKEYRYVRELKTKLVPFLTIGTIYNISYIGYYQYQVYSRDTLDVLLIITQKALNYSFEELK